MSKVAIVLLADTESLGDLGRMANALMAVQEFKDNGDEVQLILDGAGVKWVGELSKADHDYHDVWTRVEDKLAGVCQYCAGAFGVKPEVESAGAPLTDAYQGHPSFRDLVRQGYQIITF